MKEEKAYLIKNILQTLLCQRRTFYILYGSKFASESLSMLWRDRPLLLPRELFYYLRIISQIDLCAYDEARDTRAVMVDFGEPFFFNVFKGSRGSDTKTDEEDVGLGIG